MIWLLGAIIIAALIIHHHWYKIIKVNLLLFTMFLITVLMPALLLMDQQRQQPLRELSAFIVQEKQPQEELVIVGINKTSVVFYTQQQVNYIKLTQDAVEHIKNRTSQPAQPPSMLLLAKPKALVKMDLQPDTYDILHTTDSYQLIRVNWKKINKLVTNKQYSSTLTG